MGEFSITEHVGTAGLQSLSSEWRSLTDAMANVRVHHLWEAHSAYARHLATSPDAMTYFALRDATDDSLRAVCPLEARVDRALGVPLRVWGTPWSTEWPLGDVVAPEDDARAALLPAVLEHLRGSKHRRSMLVLGPLPESSVLWDGLAEESARVAAYAQSGWGSLDCSRPFDEVFSALSKNFRGNLRKARNKLALLEDVRIVIANEPAELAREFEEFLKVEASGWKGASGTGTALALHPDKVAFYRELVEVFGAQGSCWIDTLYAEGRCIASQLNFIAGTDFEMFKVGYDEDYARVAPGQMLFENTFRRCCENPTRLTLNLMSDTAWNREWGATLTPMRMARVGVTGMGRALVPAVRFRFTTARRLARRMQGRSE